MTQNNEAFEKWFGETYKDLQFNKAGMTAAWQAATQASESEINSLKQRVDELQADNLRLRDALEESKNVLEIAMTDRDGNKFVYLNTRSGSMLSALDTLDKCNKALSATAKQSLIEHDNETIAPHKKAIEFAEFMAKCIEQFMVTVNELDIADEQEDETLVDILQERRGGYWRAVNTSVYEFRKRADLAYTALPDQSAKIAELEAEIQRLNAIIAENEIDAKRYRWLKCETYNQEIVICRWNKNGCTEMFVDAIDEAIDEAMTKEK